MEVESKKPCNYYFSYIYFVYLRKFVRNSSASLRNLMGFSRITKYLGTGKLEY